MDQTIRDIDEKSTKVFDQLLGTGVGLALALLVKLIPYLITHQLLQSFS